MTDSLVRLEIQNEVARLTLNRPDKRNALTREFIIEITNAVRDVAADKSVRLLILAAEGPVFCAGMDLQQMEQRAVSPNATEEWKVDSQVYRDLLVDIFQLEIPTLAVVQGPVLAGGVGLVLACDLVLAAEAAFFALPEPKRGITAAVVTPLLVYRVGHGAASYLLLSGENVAAADALRMGLCHHVAAVDALATRADEMSAAILTGSQSALAITKKSIAMCTGSPVQPGSELLAQLEAGMQASADARETADAREGLAAFLEKRQPSWSPPC